MLTSNPKHYIWGVAPALWQHPTLSLLAKGAATVLLLHRNVKTGQCSPGYELIALELGLSKTSRTAVKRALQDLKDADLIDWQRSGRANHYDLSGLLALCDQKLLGAAEVEKAAKSAEGREKTALSKAA